MTSLSTNVIDCSICFGSNDRSIINYVVDESPICGDCVFTHLVPRFEAALLNESEYPVRWGSSEVPFLQFLDILGADFVERFQWRQGEYNTLPADRLHCRHRVLASVQLPPGAMTTRQLALTPPQVADAIDNGFELATCGAMVASRACAAGRSMACFQCNGLTCGDCSELLYTASGSHSCAAQDHPMQDADDDRFSEMVRGHDYQLCPNPGCRNPCQLSDGCNHIICPIAACKTNFCYLCGAIARDGSGHWAVGNPCPRYNQPDHQGAIYDDDDDDEDDITAQVLLNALNGRELSEQQRDTLRQMVEGVDGELEADQIVAALRSRTLSERQLDEMARIRNELNGNEPLLEAPAEGARWLDMPNPLARRNADLFLGGMESQFFNDLMPLWEVPHETAEDLGDMILDLSNNIRIQFALHFDVADFIPVADFAPFDKLDNYIAAEFRQYQEADARITHGLATLPRDMVNDHVPMFAQALDFHAAHKQGFITEIEGEIQRLRSEQ